MSLCVLFLACGASAPAEPGRWSGHVAGELALFPESPTDDRQRGNNLSLSLQPRYYREWDESNQSVTFEPFLRLDSGDPSRSHADIRELCWEKAAERWELRIGINKVFWGVTESQHLVDIINQTDFVEDVAGEEKLGQPMINLTLVPKWGTLDLFLLPGFRERTYPGPTGRLRPHPPVDVDDPEYQSGARQSHVDGALRWSHFLGAWDLGVSYFHGTSREPRFIPRFNAFKGLRLTPCYDQIDQGGLDLQYTKGAWLWKLEAMVRSGLDETYSATTGGFEYTFYGVGESAWDVGLLTEYLFDSRSTNQYSPFQNDLFIGARVSANDVQSTELLFGGIVDLESGGTLFQIEASRRLGEDWKLSLKGRVFTGLADDDPAAMFERDDHLKIELAWYF